MKLLADLDTPALWVDLDVLGGNIRSLAGRLHAAGKAWRPHTKGIKVPALAHQLLAAGAVGVTCAKLSEAEVLVDHGIQSLLVANQVVGPLKIARLVQLRRRADVMVALDNLENAAAIATAARHANVAVGVLIEVDIGLQRCGRQPGEDTLEFARAVQALPGLTLVGLMAWEGQVVGITDERQKAAACRAAVDRLVTTAQLCRGEGLPMPVVSCGGSGTFAITATVPGVTELQAGGGIFGGRQYQQWGVPFPCALFLTATVISRPTAARAVVDLGFKAANPGPFAKPVARDPGLVLTALHSEHGILEVTGSAQLPRVGDRVVFEVGYSDQTICCHDQLHGVRGETVEATWAIAGRGQLT